MALQVSPDIFVYDDSNFHSLVTPPPDMSRGHQPRNWQTQGYCQAWRGASAFPKELIVPRSEWDARWEEKQAKKATLRHLAEAAGLPHKDQNGTNYCWINAPVHCCEVMLVKQNQLRPDGKPWILSPASVGCKIKNFRNQGGWGQEGLEYMIEHGVVPVDLWPANAISRSYDKPESWEQAKAFIVKEWYDYRPRSFDEKISAHLLDLPTADGYNWWSHEVTGYGLAILSNAVRDRARRAVEVYADLSGMDKVERDRRIELAGSKYGAEERNSWKGYGDNGWFVLSESKATPDDCCSPAVLKPA